MLLIKNREVALNYIPLVLPQTSDLLPELPQPEQFDLEPEMPDVMPESIVVEPDAEPTVELPDIAALQEEAAAIIENARAEAERIIAEAHARADEIERETRQKAIQEARA